MRSAIDALWDGDEREREWASDVILSSYAARNHPFAPARRRRRETIRRIFVEVEVIGRRGGRSADGPA
jgi:hypothetical protein